MLHWITANKFRDGNRSALHPIQTTYQALLSSTVADGDIITDWIYYFDISHRNENVPQWLVIIQLTSCIFGTLSWLSVATDGRLIYWMKASFLVTIYVFIIVAIGILWLPFTFLLLIGQCFVGGNNRKVFEWFMEKLEWIIGNVLLPLWDSANHKPTFSSSTLLFFGIIVEDIPQLVVTFLIENKINSDDPTGRISGSAIVNTTFAIFDILHKLAEACDLLSDVHNAGYAYKEWIKAHNSSVVSLAIVPGSSDWMLMSGASLDMTVKLWDTVKGKLKSIKTFKCNTEIEDAVVIRSSSKVMAACQDNKIHSFDFETGDILGSPIELGFKPRFVSLSRDSSSIFTSGDGASMIQSFDVETNVPLSTYNQRATTLSFLDNDMFVSSAHTSTNCFVWNVNNNAPIHTI